jgi:hypothetical protein
VTEQKGGGLKIYLDEKEKRAEENREKRDSGEAALHFFQRSLLTRENRLSKHSLSLPLSLSLPAFPSHASLFSILSRAGVQGKPDRRESKEALVFPLKKCLRAMPLRL